MVSSYLAYATTLHIHVVFILPDVLSRDMFKLALSDFFEDKDEADIEQLVRAAEQESNITEANESFTYANLFIEVKTISTTDMNMCNHSNIMLKSHIKFICSS